MSPSSTRTQYPDTPDGKYFVVRGRLWRKSNPALDQATREKLVKELMSARRAVRHAQNDAENITDARRRVNDTKVALGERGPVWWSDGEPDLNRHLVKNSPYASWFAELDKTRHDEN
ncbi:hypothetical protein [Agrobacterium sp.]|jgi:hypothetical protein|uniref:hypothetical protein n=1 Tax=Agrobacterium sp. TaxID=361 RepID=UPI0028A61BC8